MKIYYTEYLYSVFVPSLPVYVNFTVTLVPGFKRLSIETSL